MWPFEENRNLAVALGENEFDTVFVAVQLKNNNNITVCFFRFSKFCAHIFYFLFFTLAQREAKVFVGSDKTNRKPLVMVLWWNMEIITSYDLITIICLFIHAFIQALKFQPINWSQKQ